MKKFTAILQTNKEPKDTNALWYHKGVLKYYGNNGWELFNEINPEDIPISIDSIPEAKNLKEALDYLEKQAKDYRVVQSPQDLEQMIHENPGSVIDGTRAYVTDTGDSYIYNLANNIWMKDDNDRFTTFKILAKTAKVLKYDAKKNTVSLDIDISELMASKYIYIAYEDQNYKTPTIDDLSYCTLATLENNLYEIEEICGNALPIYEGMTVYIVHTDLWEDIPIPIVSLNPDILEEGIYEVVLRYYTWINTRDGWYLDLKFDVYDTLINHMAQLSTINRNIQELNTKTAKLDTKLTTLDTKIDSTNYLTSLSYGVRINGYIVKSRIGNTEFNNTLPIQNGMKGCIVKIKDGKADIQYYLNQDDFRWCPQGKEAVLNTIEDMDYTIIDESTGTFTVTLHTTLGSEEHYNPNRLKGTWVHSYNKTANGYTCECMIISVDPQTNKITLKPKEKYSIETLKAEMNDEFYTGSVLNGYDGEVMIEVPSFYLKGFKTDTINYEVRITPYFIDSSWEHQPRILVSAFCNTVLNEVPEDMGYLSTLPVGAAISVVNTEPYCRGGNNDPQYDSNLEEYPFSTNLGKPRTNISRANMRKYARLGGKEVMSYLEYKRIFYWLWVIEYANSNTRSPLDEGLTGIDTSVLTSSPYSYPMYPNGYILNNPGIYSAYNKNNQGNKTYFSVSGFGSNKAFSIIQNIYLKTNSTPQKDRLTPIIWHGFENPLGNVLLNVDGIVLDGTDNRTQMKVYITDNPELYGESTKGMTHVGTLSTGSTQGGIGIGYFVENDDADIYPSTKENSIPTYGKHWYNGLSNSTALRTVLFGSCATTGSVESHLRNFFSNSALTRANIEIGFRTVFVLDK